MGLYQEACAINYILFRAVAAAAAAAASVENNETNSCLSGSFTAQ